MAYSSGSITIENIAVRESDWLSASAWLSDMVAGSGSNPPPEKAPPSTSPSRSERREASPPRLNLLLAEDNLPDTLLVREAIKMEGLPVEVYVVPDGELAVEFIARAERDPDAPFPHVLLLDLNLPKVDGFEVLRKVREIDRLRNIPILIVTSSDSPADRQQAAKLGVGYFRKPVSYDEFLKIGGFLRRLLTENGLL